MTDTTTLDSCTHLVAESWQHNFTGAKAMTVRWVYTYGRGVVAGQVESVRGWANLRASDRRCIEDWLKLHDVPGRYGEDFGEQLLLTRTLPAWAVVQLRGGRQRPGRKLPVVRVPAVSDGFAGLNAEEAQELHELMCSLAEYADRFRELNGEPEDGNCARTVRAAQEWIDRHRRPSATTAVEGPSRSIAAS